MMVRASSGSIYVGRFIGQSVIQSAITWPIDFSMFLTVSKVNGNNGKRKTIKIGHLDSKLETSG